MGNVLAKECRLYQTLLNEFESGKNNKETFFKCVETAQKADKKERYYILYQLKSLYRNSESGIDAADTITKLLSYFAGHNERASFIIAVLDVSLNI